MCNILDKIKNKASKFDLIADQVSNNTLIVYSNKYKFDSWLITINNKKIYLHHKNKLSNRDKCYYHLQSSFDKKNWMWSLQKISDHNKYIIEKKDYRKINLVDIVLEKYKKERGLINA